MRIAIVGSHGVGKTTLSTKLSEYFGFPRIPDIVRQASEKKFFINEETPPESQMWILSKQIELERNTPIPWVADKALYDNVVYGNVILRDQKVKDVIRDIVIKEARYDMLLYVPIEFDIQDDGLRSLDVRFQKSIDNAYLRFLSEHRLFFHIIRGTVDQRLQHAAKLIEPFLDHAVDNHNHKGIEPRFALSL